MEHNHPQQSYSGLPNHKIRRHFNVLTRAYNLCCPYQMKQRLLEKLTVAKLDTKFRASQDPATGFYAEPD
jgi:hypothetical protein